MENFDSEDGDMLDYYIQIGAIEVAGISEDGEFIFGITDIAKDVAPDLWEAHQNHVDESMLQLYDMGLINITYDEDLNATFELTEEGKEVSKQFGLIQMDDPEIPNNQEDKMPWQIKQNAAGCSGYAVVKQDTGELVGCHSGRTAAEAQLRALYASESDAKKMEHNKKKIF